jgi:hypothetical protein
MYQALCWMLCYAISFIPDQYSLSLLKWVTEGDRNLITFELANSKYKPIFLDSNM